MSTTNNAEHAWRYAFAYADCHATTEDAAAYANYYQQLVAGKADWPSNIDLFPKWQHEHHAKAAVPPPVQEIPMSVSLIETLDALNGGLNQRVALVADETVAIVGQWDRLGTVGGQRDDAAARLLMNLVPGLKSLGSFVAHCLKQIEAYHADPFKDR